jgi:tetratricopeptide (TPR) repeat protein
MRKIIFLILLLLSTALSGFAQASVSYQQQAWDLGNNLSLAALLNAASSDSGLVGRTFTSAKINAKNLKINLPELPLKTGDKIKDNAAALSYLLNTTGMPIMKILTDTLGAKHAALFELAFKTNILILLYDPDGKETAAIVGVIDKRHNTAGLPSSTFSELKRLIAARSGSEVIKKEVFALQKLVPLFVAAGEYSENGELLYQRKEYARSAGEISRALEISPTEPQFYYLRARSYMQDSKYAEAIADYTKVIQFARSEKEKSNLPTVYHNRGLCHALTKRLPLALTDLNMSIKLKPEYASAYRIRSLVHKQMGNPKLAAADSQKAESLQPGIMQN